MPWAGDDVSAQYTFTKRASGVRTDAVQHMKDTVDVEDCKNSAICHNFRTAAWRDGCDIYQRDCCHDSCYSSLIDLENVFGFAEYPHDIATQNLVDRFFVVATIQ